MQGGTLGVDTIRVGGPVDDCDRSAKGWSVRAVVGDDGAHIIQSRLRTMENGARLEVVPTLRGPQAFVEFSVPKLLGDDNLEPATLGEAVTGAARATAEAAGFVTWSDPRALHVTRLDVARDFTDVDSPALVLAGLSSVPLAGRKTRDVIDDPTRGNAQTLRVRTKRAGMGRLYDKFEETRDDRARGRLRFEAEERTHSLARAGLRYLDADYQAIVREQHNFGGPRGVIGAGDLYNLARARFDWCGMGREVVSADVMVRRAQASDLRPLQVVQLLGYLQVLRHGDVELVSRSTRSRIRARLRALNLHDRTGDEPATRLDFDAGLIAA